MKVIKRNDSEQDFCLEKIVKAVKKANNSVPKEDQMNEEAVQKVINTVQKSLEGFNSVKVEDIQDLVEKALVRHNKYVISKAYIIYRQKKKEQKKFTENEEKVLSLVSGNSDLRGDNANKNIDDNGSMRDYFAGILSKSLTDKLLPKKISEAHKKGLIHFHDADYHINPEHNCDLIDGEDMFTNGFQMQNTKIEPNEGTPFRTACNLFAQINLIVSGRQYGGQTISWSHVLPFIDYSRKMIRKQIIDDFAEVNVILDEDVLNRKVEKKLREEIYEGVKTYQYQILCHSSSNGQTPFVSNNICLREAQTQQELDDFALLIEEILKRRIKGVKDQSGHYITPLFPKLLYWLSDGVNLNENDAYFRITQLAAECESMRMQPDINSEKECRRIKKGQIIPSMGCRSWLSPIWEDNEYPVDTEFYWVKGNSRGEYPYGTFVDKKSFSSIPNGKYVVPNEDDYTLEEGYGKADYVINFRGNTGWLLEKTDDKVVIRQPKVYGRWNNGVVTINLPHVALEAMENEPENLEARSKKFYEILDGRLELCREALKIRYEHCSNIKAKNSSILWMYGALSRMTANETVGELMKKYPKRASISLGFVGLYETCEALICESNTTENGQHKSIEVLTYINDRLNKWKEEDHMNYSLYGTPEESLTLKFSLANRRDFGFIPKITDKDYVVNSYHVDPRENIDAFKKLEIEGKYLALSSGGAVSYVETGDLTKNPEAIISIMQWMYHHIVYAEINRIIGICYECGHVGEFKLVKTEDGKFEFICPCCGNKDDDKMDVRGRLCGYLGTINAKNVNAGRLDDINNRRIHTDCKDEVQ